MVTIKDIAKYANISVSTVSKGLSKATDISEETRAAVENAARELGYHKRRNKKGKLCVMVANMGYENADQFGYDILFGFRSAANTAGYATEIILMDPKSHNNIKYQEVVDNNSFLGGFLLGFNLGDAYLADLENVEIPTVLLDNYIRNPKVAYAGTDNAEGVALAVEYLVNLGHNKIAFINGDKSSYVANERGQAFFDAMRRHNIAIDKELVTYGSYAENTVNDILDGFLCKNITAVMCASDLIASWVLADLYKRNINVPADISVLGFDNMPLSQHTRPPLTTIEQKRGEIGRSAFIVLDSLMKGLSTSKLLIKPALVIRDSAAVKK